MKFFNIPNTIAAVAILSLPCKSKPGRGFSHLKKERHSHNRIHASPRAEDSGELLQKRGVCAFPTDAGLVAVTPGSMNAGWAMSPDQACKPNSYCPYACPPGQVMAQWNPKATSYTYPLSMDGGLYCDSNGKINKPFPNQPYCVSGTGTVRAVSSCGGSVSFCQTVLPGNEAMLIPTAVDGSSLLAVPGTSYWCETAAHYYINAPGVSTSDACIWGDGSKPIGNWAPYVAGANTVANGDTYVKIGWNPIWTGSAFSKTMPTFGIKIECSGPGCNGLPCSIDPSIDGIGGVNSPVKAVGAGGASFCVVTVPSGLTADVVVFELGGSGSSASSPSQAAPSNASPTSIPTPAYSSSSSTPMTSSTPPPSTSSSSSISPTPKPASSSSSSSLFSSSPSITSSITSSISSSATSSFSSSATSSISSSFSSSATSSFSSSATSSISSSFSSSANSSTTSSISSSTTSSKTCSKTSSTTSSKTCSKTSSPTSSISHSISHSISSSISSSLISMSASPTSCLCIHTTSSIPASTYPTDNPHVCVQAGTSTSGAASTFISQTVSATGSGSVTMSPTASATATASIMNESAATATEVSNLMFGLVLLLVIGCLI